MMHLAFLTSEYPHPRVSRAAGIGTSIKNLATALVAKNMRVSLFIYAQQENAVFEENGITFHLIQKKKYPVLGWFLYRKHLQNYINKTHANDPIDAIEAPDWTGITAFMKLKMPLVIRLHGTDAYFCDLEGRTQKKKNFMFEKRALVSADHILSVSDFTAQHTKDIFTLKKQITTIYNGIDVDQFQPLSVPERPKSFVYFGTIIRKKGVFELAQAFEKVLSEEPQATLTLIGRDSLDIRTGAHTVSLLNKSIHTATQTAITHKSHMPYEEVKKEIAAATVVVLPSHAEAFPMSWLEAMAMEKALVTSNIGWANELMQDAKTGRMVDPTNIEALAKAMMELLDSKELRKRYGKNARQRIITSFASESIVQQNIAFYKSIVE